MQIFLVLLGKPLLQLLRAVLAQAMAQAFLNLLKDLEHVPDAWEEQEEGVHVECYTELAYRLSACAE